MSLENRKYHPEEHDIEEQPVKEIERFSAILPAFRHIHTGETHLSCDKNGVPAPVHLIEHLPKHWLRCNMDKSECSLKDNVEKGYVVLGHFFNKEDASGLLPH